MNLKVPRIHMDPKQLRQGIWGNSWKTWGSIALAFLCIWSVAGGYFTGLLFAAKGIRGDEYRSVVDKFFGRFDTNSIPYIYPLSAGQTTSFQRPEGCVDLENDLTVAGQVYQRPNGIQSCDTGEDGNQWVLFPWTLDTNGLGRYPGCSNPQGASETLSTFLSQPTSPAYYGNDVVAPQAAVDRWVCQNFVGVSAE